MKQDLETGVEDQAFPSQGATLAQRAGRRELRRFTRQVSALLGAYADEMGSAELAGNVQADDYAPLQGPLAQVLAEARRIETLAKAHEPALSALDSQLSTLVAFGAAIGG